MEQVSMRVYSNMQLPINEVNFKRLSQLESLNQMQLNVQLAAIKHFISQATPQQIRCMQFHFIFYKGRYKQYLSYFITLRKLQFPLSAVRKTTLLYELEILHQSQGYWNSRKYATALVICLIIVFKLIVFASSITPMNTLIIDPNKILEQELILELGITALFLMGFIVWAHGFCGYKGYIYKRLEELENRITQIRGLLI